MQRGILILPCQRMDMGGESQDTQFPPLDLDHNQVITTAGMGL